MCSFKFFIICCVMLSVCYCQHTHDKHKYTHKKCNKYDILWHGFHYLAFLALKVKFLFIVGSIFTVGLLAGKIFAVFKFAEYMKHKQNNDHHEKVYVMASHEQPHDYSSYGKAYAGQASSHHQSFPPGFSLDQPPPGANIVGADGGNMNQPYGASGPGQDFGGLGQGQPNGQAYGPPSGYGRSNDFPEGSFYDNFNAFNKLVRRLNITEMIFDQMNVKSMDCKRKFVCESDFNAKESVILKAALDMFIDDSYKRYKTDKIVKTFEECGVLYSSCREMNSNTSNSNNV